MYGYVYTYNSHSPITENQNKEMTELPSSVSINQSNNTVMQESLLAGSKANNPSHLGQIAARLVAILNASLHGQQPPT
jgi:hypothetical protein